jgi:histidinol-phosphate aminotransferase
MIEPKTLKLSSNENCYGCSPLVLDAIMNQYKEVYFYPEPNPVALKERIAVKFGVASRNIVVGAGSVQIIDGLIQMLVEPDEKVLTFENSFIAYGLFSGYHHRSCLYAPLTGFRCVPDNLLHLITDKTRLIFIANPNNPTGTIISHAELESFMSKIPQKIIVAVDEAYAEYVNDLSFPESVVLQRKYPNLVILRSFSKIYGLAGLRIGYAVMDENLASILLSRQIPFSINYLSPNAAIAALVDVDFVQKSAIANAELRQYLYVELKKLGYQLIPSQTNYLYIWFDKNEEKMSLYKRLFEHGIVICDLITFGQSNALRITIGNKEVCEKIIQILKMDN